MVTSLVRDNTSLAPEDRQRFASASGKQSMATSDEQEVLAQYVGWGGLPMAFDEHNVTWAKEHKQLKELLSPPEYEAARESVLNAHYTSPTVIRAVYEAIGNMGFLIQNPVIFWNISAVQVFLQDLPSPARSRMKMTAVTVKPAAAARTAGIASSALPVRTAPPVFVKTNAKQINS